jgi:spore coat protein U-like protein
VRINVTILAALLLCAAAPAQAGLLTCGSGVLFASNVVIAVSDLSFGNYTPASTDFASTGISVTCGALGIDLLPSFTVSLTAANGTSPATRYLDKSGSHLNYNIYTSNAYGAVWGDGTGGSVTQTYSATLTLGAVNYTAWGRVPASQYVAAGSYSDRITVTVSY